MDLSSNTSDYDSTAIGATYYFDDVDDGDAPYALSAFFDPATLVSATLSRPSRATDTRTVGGRYLIAPSLWYVGGRFIRNANTDIDLSTNTYGVMAGKYLGPRTTIELGIDRLTSELASSLGVCSFPPCPLVPFSTTAKTETTSLSVVHVRQFRSLTYVLAGGLQRRMTDFTLTNSVGVPGANVLLPDSSSLRTYSLETTLYPTRKLGVRIGYEDTYGGTRYTDGTYSVGARWFLRPKVAFEFSMSRTDFNEPLQLYNAARLRSFSIIGRF